MYIILYDFDTPMKEGVYQTYLSNGEQAVERQLRILQSMGMRRIRIAGNPELFAYCEKLTKQKKRFCRMEFEYLGENITSDMLQDRMETYLMLAYNLLYTKEDFRLFLSGSEKYAIAALPKQKKGYQGLSARLDMDWIVELGVGLVGLDTCPVLPMVKIAGGLLEDEDIPPSSLPLNCSGGWDFLKGILEALSPSEKGILWFANQKGLRLLEGRQEEFKFSTYMKRREYSDQKVISGQGFSVYIKDIVQENQAEHILLVCDHFIDKTPIEALFAQQNISCKKCLLSEELTKEQNLEHLKRMISQEDPDLIVALGKEEIIEAVRNAQMLPNEKPEKNYPDRTLAAVPSAFIRRRDLLADYWILDANLVKAAFDEEKDRAQIYLLLYQTVCALMQPSLEAEDKAVLSDLLLDLASAREGFLTGQVEKIQEAFRCHHTINCILQYYHAGAEDIPEVIGQEIKEEAGVAAAVLLPFLMERIYARIPDTMKPGSKLEKDMKLLSAGTNISYGENLKEELSGYIQNLVNFGILFGNEDYPSLIGSIMERVKCAVDANALSFCTTEDLEQGIRSALSLNNRKLEPDLEFRKPETEEEAEWLALELEKKEKEEIKKLPFIKRLLHTLKNYKLFNAFHTNVIKKGRYKLYQTLYSVQTKWIVFESYGGTENFGCNTRAIYEAMLSDPDYFDYKFIWAFINPKEFEYLKRKNPNTVVVKRNSKSYIKYCARSKYIFTNTGMPKYIVPNKEQKMVYTWHGKPLKRIGCSFKGESEGKRSKKQLLKHYTATGRRLTILTSPSPVFTPIMADAYNLSSAKRKTAMLETGYPRNDSLFRYTPEDVLRLKMNLGIPFDKKVILYAPTWRPFRWIEGKHFEHVAALDIEKLHQDFSDDYVFLFRLHHLERDSMHFDQFPGFLYDVSMVQDVNELYMISDLLISDYSGTIFDFANLCRPIVLFMHDKEEYAGEANGLNFELDFLPGPIVETQQELTEAVKDQIDHFVCDEKYKKFNELCNGLDGPDCAYRTAHQIVEVNPPASRKQERLTKTKIFVRNTMLTMRGYMQKIPFVKNENTKRIASFHNKYKGKRCFLIGNGPSLRLSDLNMLKDEICFGCNMIYKVFERTDWRPTFLCASDRVVAKAASEQLQAHPESTLWVTRTAFNLMKYKGNNLIYVSNLNKDKFYVHGDMTEYYVPSKATVMTFMIELAMYMGFQDIYLLGVDFTIGRSTNDHFMNSYRDKEMTTLEHKKLRNMFKGSDIGVHEAQIRFEGKALEAYQELEKFSRKHGHHVYNATRGGMLEVFERVDLDEVVHNR